MPWGQGDAIRPSASGHARSDPAESWVRRDLGPALRGEIVSVTPTILTREDGKAIFYAGRINWIHGDSGLGKTWVALVAAATELTAGRAVTWIDFEEPTEEVVVERLLQLGVPADAIEALLAYHCPNDPTGQVELQMLEAEAAELGVRLIVIDSLGEAFAMDDINEDKDAEVAPWLRRVLRRLAATGAAVVVVDHSTKANDNPLHPSGSKRKRAALSGAGYHVTAPVPLTREDGGKLRLTCAKDRHGHHRRGQVAAEIVMTVYPDGGTTVHVTAPDEPTEATPDEKLRVVARAAVRAVKERKEGGVGYPVSLKQLRSIMKAKASQAIKDAAIEYAVGEGALRMETGSRNAHLHYYVHDLPK